ncbi:MAG: glycosyltransferase [Clostridiales bacterium]|nr:glycosyltransferase [Clostridiales bacterium]
MRVAIINMIPYGSTGKIMLQLADLSREKGLIARTYSTTPYDKKKKKTVGGLQDHYQWGSIPENKRHYFLGSLFDRNGCYSRKGTKNLIEDLENFSPDVIHLHNLHKFCINLPLLFNYLKKSNKKVLWTLHDCWTFTGHCPHFDMIGCDKWKTGCYKCPQYKAYPKSYIDRSKSMYKLKKKWFTGVENMTIVTPSNWLGDLVKQSFLKEYPVKIIPNGIDLSVFKPTESNFREKYYVKDKFVILGVAFGWGKRKGLDVFIELSKRLDKNFQIVLVGTDENLDKQLPENIISIHRTQNQIELAEIYSAADLFVNPTREDTFPTVNIESLACGTPIVTFRTGGSPDVIDKTCGSVVDKNDVDGIEKEIIRIKEQKPYSKEACLKRASNFDKSVKFAEYIDLYKE